MDKNIIEYLNNLQNEYAEQQKSDQEKVAFTRDNTPKPY